MVWGEAQGSAFHLGNVLGWGWCTAEGKPRKESWWQAVSTLPQSFPLLMNPHTHCLEERKGKGEAEN